MEINKQFLQISAIAFTTSLIPQILSNLMVILRDSTFFFPHMSLSMFLDYVDMCLGFAISPILIFAVFYYFGKKSNIVFEIRQIMFALFIGNIASFLVGSLFFTAIFMQITIFYFTVFLLQFIFAFFVTSFLLGLAGLYMGYTKEKS